MRIILLFILIGFGLCGLIYLAFTSNLINVMNINVKSDVQFQQAKQPNIIFVLADDLGYGDLGIQGSNIKTPFIDNMAEEGVILNKHYVLHTCSPSRAALLTGRYPIKTGIYRNIISNQPIGLNLTFQLLPELMRNLNYKTHLVGKWHLGFYKKEYLPTNRGFDTFFGIVVGGEYKMSHEKCESFPTPCPGRKDGKCCGYVLYNQTNIADDKYKGKHSTTIYFKRAIDIVREHAKNAPQKPLFMMITLTAPHVPLVAPYRYIYANKHIGRIAKRIYAGMITQVDHWMERLRNSLVQHDMWNNTVLVFASDNGRVGSHSSGKNLKGGKRNYYEAGVRSIAFIASPLIQRKGKRIDSLFHITDWLPTFTSLGGAVHHDSDLDGYNMWGVINNENVENPRKSILHGFDMPENKTPWFSGSRSFICNTSVKGALLVGKWKLLTGLDATNGSRYALYNLAKDEEETVDLSGNRPKRLKKMCHIMKSYYKNAVPLEYEPIDPLSNPKLYGNKWIPWKKS